MRVGDEAVSPTARLRKGTAPAQQPTDRGRQAAKGAKAMSVSALNGAKASLAGLAQAVIE